MDRRGVCVAALLLSGAASGQAFRNCTEAREAGYTNIPRSSAFYSRNLDRDGDGVACEQNGNDAPYRYDPSRPFVLPNPNTSGGSASSTPPVTAIYGPASPIPPDYAALKVFRIVRINDDGGVVLNADYRDIKVRLSGLALPEKQEAAAVAWLRVMMPVNTYAFVEFQGEDRTEAGERLAFVWLDRQLVNAQALQLGVVELSPEPARMYTSFLQAAEAEARDGKRGIWAQ